LIETIDMKSKLHGAITYMIEIILKKITTLQQTPLIMIEKMY